MPGKTGLRGSRTCRIGYSGEKGWTILQFRILVLCVGAVAMLASGCASWQDLADQSARSNYAEASGGKPGIPNKQPYDLAIVAEDGTFLGRPGSSYAADSIGNELGQYGNKWNRQSMFNDTSPYGSKTGAESARNKAALNPPKLYRGQTFLGYVTSNKSRRPRIDPETLREDGKKNRYIVTR